MVDVDLDEDDYRVIISWYEIAFAHKEDKIKEKDLELMHKLMIMAKAMVAERKKFTSDND